MTDLFRHPVATSGYCTHCAGEFRALCHDRGAYAVFAPPKSAFAAPVMLSKALCCYCSSTYAKTGRLPARTMKLPFDSEVQL
jgi:hypothetical protein